MQPKNRTATEPPTSLEDIDWARWIPREKATLLFILKDQQILLIHKKRGLGAGKINGPGGRLEPGETPIQAAIREVEEEVCVTPRQVRERGELRFQFCDGYSILGTVFTATDFTGEPRETDEAKPFWAPTDQIPYDRMWADDRIWLPEMLAGRSFRGRFLFDGDRMLGHELEILPPGPASELPVGAADQDHPDGLEQNTQVEKRIHVPGIIQIVENGIRK
ncbi:MAG: 8-oxo-dGTP diphosphatase [Kiritimatiellia bacterium]|nr:8-oxo-dGTP diphosphatase [Kiritimatiellia bacterium]